MEARILSYSSLYLAHIFKLNSYLMNEIGPVIYIKHITIIMLIAASPLGGDTVGRMRNEL